MGDVWLFSSKNAVLMNAFVGPIPRIGVSSGVRVPLSSRVKGDGMVGLSSSKSLSQVRNTTSSLPQHSSPAGQKDASIQQYCH